MQLRRAISQDEFESTTEADRCKLLWCAALKLQWDLAFPSGRARPDPTALGWFGTKDFHTVCALADVDADAVLARFELRVTR
jgi:hypothetical protein